MNEIQYMEMERKREERRYQKIIDDLRMTIENFSKKR